MGSFISDLAGDDTWLCMICKAADRPFDAISVVQVPDATTPEQPWNVSYCNDRAACTTAALSATSWPPAA